MNINRMRLLCADEVASTVNFVLKFVELALSFCQADNA